MSEGWGQDFDEEGNVIGEVPEKEDTLLVRHKYKVVGLAFVWFLLTALGNPGSSPGFFIGTAIGSTVAACALVSVGAWLYGKTN